MESKPFYIDSSLGLCKSYADLLRDAAEIREIPCTYGSEKIYEVFTVLLAAICNDVEIVLTSDSSKNSGDHTVSFNAITEFSKLQNTVTNSQCKIGVFTSGTTGRPKVIQHRTDTLIRSVKTGERHRNDVWGLTYHPASFAGLQVFFQAICNSNPLIRLSGLEASAVHEAIRNEGVTHLSATPTWMRLVCSDSVVHPHVLSITTGGEITDRALIQQIESTFPNAKFRNIYASTESGSLLKSDGDSFRVPHYLADLVKVQDGMLAIHRSLLAESIRNECQNDFYVSGDTVEIVSLDPLTLRFAARRNDWINVGGYKVNPNEVEQSLLAIPGVSDARVFGRKNSVTGNIVCCEIMRSAGFEVTQADIRRTLELQLPSYKIPRILEFVESIAKTPSGKKSRTE